MKRKTIAVLTVVLALLAPSLSRAEDYKFTALFILNFARYVTWPQQSGDFTIGVFGSDPVVPELAAIAEQATVNSQKIVVKKVADAGQAAGCNILYLPPDQSGRLSDMLAKFGSSGVLIVTNKPGLAAEGAAINLVLIDGKQRYEINTASLKKSGLVAKPVLFKIGKAVES